MKYLYLEKPAYAQEKEIADFECQQTAMPEPTSGERIAALENDNAELREALEALRNGAKTGGN